MTPPDSSSAEKEDKKLLKSGYVFCGNHPGMSCRELHFDDDMRIVNLRLDIDKLTATVEEMKSKQSDLVCNLTHAVAQKERLESQVRELRKGLIKIFSIDSSTYSGQIARELLERTGEKE